MCAVRAADSRPAGSSPQLRAAIVEQSRRGLRLQVLLRGSLAVFVLVAVTIVSPARNATACYVVAGAYAVWVVSIAVLGWRGGAMALRMVWVVLLVDLVALGTLTVLAGASARESWTADVLVNGFLLVPVLAATQLAPRIGAAILAPTVGVYLAVSIATRDANAEPWSSVALRTAVLIGISVGCVALSWDPARPRGEDRALARATHRPGRAADEHRGPRAPRARRAAPRRRAAVPAGRAA
jgi:two-component system, NarL family, sensor kinase